MSKRSDGIQRINRDGMPTRYRVQVRRKGHRPISKTFSKYDDARAWRRNVEADAGKIEAAANQIARRKTVADAIDTHIAEHSLPERHGKVKLLRWWRLRLGHRILADLSRRDIADALAELRREPKLNGGHKVRSTKGQRRSPATVNRYHAAISAVLRDCVSSWAWLDENVARKISRPDEDNERVRWLKDDERNALLDACRASQWPGLYPLAILALCTGARQGELLKLRWSQVDLKQGYAYVTQTKNKEPRTLVVVGPAITTLREWSKVRRIHTDYVFPSATKDKPFGAFRAYWDKAVEDAGLEDFRFHDLRHSCASYLTQKGVPIQTVAAVLGHKVLDVARRYSHLDVEHKREALEKVFGGES